jgi:hypothetical protein
MPLPMIASLTLLIFASISFLLPPTLTIQPSTLIDANQLHLHLPLNGMFMICQYFYKLWKTLAFPFAFLCTKLATDTHCGLSKTSATITGVIDMTAAPLWLIQNVRLPDREGLWQIAIDKGRFGISPRWARRATKV